MAIETVANITISLILIALSSLVSSGLLTLGIKLAKIKTTYRKTLLLAFINSIIYYFILVYVSDYTTSWYPVIVAQLPGFFLIKFFYKTDWGRAALLMLAWSLFFIPIFLFLYGAAAFGFGPAVYLAFGLKP